MRVLSGALGIPKATVEQHDRNLLVAGFRSKRGRGWAAPNVTARDIAHLITAILGSPQVKDSAATVRRYNATKVRPNASSKGLFAEIGIEELAALPVGHSFVDALEALFTATSTGSLEGKLAAKARKERTDKIWVAPTITIEALAPGTEGSVSIGGDGVIAVATYQPPRDASRSRLQRGKHRHVHGDLEEYRRISEKTILRVADLLIPSKEET